MNDSTAEPSWSDLAEWWIREFTDGVDPEYVDQIIPMVVADLGGGGRVLDLGCGEGQIARALAATGCAVVGVDPTPGQIAGAVNRSDGPEGAEGSATATAWSSPHYARAQAESLPFADRSFDAVVVALVLEHLDDLDGVLAEIARVLGPGGRLALFLNHPVTQTPGSGWIDDQVLDPPEQYWRIGPYLVEASSVEEVDHGVFVRFVHRPLSRYLNAAAAIGLVLERMVEPAPPERFLERAPEYRLAATIPRLMYLRFGTR